LERLKRHTAANVVPLRATPLPHAADKIATQSGLFRGRAVGIGVTERRLIVHA
jgi:hypothetical protein